MSGAKRREGASNSHNLTVVEKLLIIHSIYGNAASEVPAKRKRRMALSISPRMALQTLDNSKVYSCCV